MASADERLAFIAIHAGAGDLESQDWVQMLMHMYLRWCERAGFKVEVVDLLTDEDGGITAVTIEVAGDDACGVMRGENGVHRLVRISPFDPSSRRHMSFALVSVTGEIEDPQTALVFGSAIRSYTFHPYQLIKDHRTGLAVGNVEAVMDGELDAFIKAYRLWARERAASVASVGPLSS